MNRRVWIVAVTSLVITACASIEAPKDIVSVAAAKPQFSIFSALVVEAGLSDSLKAPGASTVFAPTDEAFKSIPEKKFAELKADKEKLKAVLSFHVVPGALNSAAMTPGKYKTSNGAELVIQKAGDLLTVNEEAIVTTPDIVANNGVIQGIDRVLTPPAPKK